MSFDIDTMNYPTFIPHTVLCLGALVLVNYVSKNKSNWWNNNEGFKDNKWIFPLNVMVIVGFILTVIYMWIWYRCLYLCENNTVNIIFGTTFGLFFCSYLALFLFEDNRVSFWLAVATILVMIFQIYYIWTRASLTLVIPASIILIFIVHYTYQVKLVRV